MSCKMCHSKNLSTFPSEVSIHFPGFANVTKPPVWSFPELVVCLDCGFTEFRIEAAELRGLVEGGTLEAA